MRALYLGRFNPPHKGHIKVIDYISQFPEVDEIIVAIGSGEKAYSLDNPFTGGERVEMMKILISTHFDYSKFYVMAIPDANRYTIWAAHVIDLVPSFDIVFTNNPLVQTLFRKLTSKRVESIPFFNREEYSGKKIRKKILENEDWKKFIPEPLVPLIEKYEGEERLRYVNMTDE